MNTEKLSIALNEFVHVGGALVVVIAVVSLLTGFMREYIPQDKLQKKLTKHEKFGPLLGAFLGMLTPFCSASVVPVTMGMASMGISLGTVLSFLVSAPLCNFIVIAMVYAVFGFKVTAAYFAIAFTAAVAGGWLITKTPWRNEIKRGEELGDRKAAGGCSAAAPTSCGQGPAPAPSCSRSESVCGEPLPLTPCEALASGGTVAAVAAAEPGKPQLALRFAWALFKKIIPYVLLGALISGVSAAYLSADIVEKYVGGDSLLSIFIAAVIGVPVYLRIEMAVPLLKVLIAKGMGLGPAMALIIGGTGASLPEIALVSSVLKPKAVVAFVAIVLSAAVVGGILIQWVL
ncbi:permease [Pelagicoccus sp. SDUM812005]|uniref:permease n=1 Tax=Pelagicoccus sp. SDUM812005 TaxID=3041257 RepID=UPI00280E9224|nr:permease [Pelagicoccus sp. SDUM812005]MDQ8182605.1 permease [Pelagicoccus sp. SDUM812005]